MPSNNNGCDQHCVVFAEKCLFRAKKTKGVLRKVTKCVTKYAEDFIILTVARRFDLGSLMQGNSFTIMPVDLNSLEVEEVKERFVSQRQANP